MPRSRRRRRTPRPRGPSDEWVFIGGISAPGDPHWSPEELRQWWPQWRREAWAQTGVGRVPWGAEEFDGLRTKGREMLWWHLGGLTEGDRDAILTELDKDRAALAAFKRRDPAGAQNVADYLSLLEADFQRVEEIARAAVGASFQDRATLLQQLAQRGFYGGDTYNE